MLLKSDINAIKKCVEAKGKVDPKWFGGSKITLKKSLFLTYCFVYQMTYDATIHETSIEMIGDIDNLETQEQLTTSQETVCDYKRYCHEICMNIVFE